MRGRPSDPISTSGPGPAGEYAKRKIFPDSTWRTSVRTTTISADVSGLLFLTMSRAAGDVVCAPPAVVSSPTATNGAAVLLKRFRQLRIAESPRLLKRRPARFVLDAAIGAGCQQRAKRRRVAEVDGRR